MNPRLQYLFDRLEAQHQTVLQSIAHIPNELFIKRPPSGNWSLSEILAHLQTSEQLSIQYLNKKILGTDQYKNTDLRHELLMLVLKISQRLPFKFKAPKVLVSNTPMYTTKEHLIEQWANTQQQLKELLEKFGDDQLRKQIYRHPVAGLINIQQALIFFREHIIHHQPQINRLL